MDASSNAQVAEVNPEKEKGVWKTLIQTLIRPPKHAYPKSSLGVFKFIQVLNDLTTITLFIEGSISM